MGTDRLSLPEALLALGVIRSAESVALELVDESGGVSRVSVKPLPTTALEWNAPSFGEAERKNARLVIDVRHNFGGSGGLNKTLVTSIIRNEYLNRHDRTFVLIGRRTFSADSYRDDFSAVLLELGHEFESADQVETADLTYQVGRYFYPDHAGLKVALESLALR